METKDEVHVSGPKDGSAKPDGGARKPEGEKPVVTPPNKPDGGTPVTPKP